jgi:hypothetical protein
VDKLLGVNKIRKDWKVIISSLKKTYKRKLTYPLYAVTTGKSISKKYETNKEMSVEKKVTTGRFY